jgi:hypothetical protein
LGHYLCCLSNGDEFELLSAKIGIIHRRFMPTPSPFREVFRLR